MPCKKHSDELEGHSDLECEACELDDKATEAYWRQLYEGEKQAGLLDRLEYRRSLGLPDPYLDYDERINPDSRFGVGS